MAKSLRSKRKKRLRTLRREIAEPFYDKKEAAKLAAQAAALAAPTLPVRLPASDSMAASATTSSASRMDVEMADGGSSGSTSALKPVGNIGKKKIQLQLKIKKDRRRSRSKGKFGKKKI